MDGFIFSKSPTVSSFDESKRVRNHLLKYGIEEIAFSCPYCFHSHTIDRKNIHFAFPLKKGVPATKCCVCKRFIYISLISNNPNTQQLKIKL